MSRIGKSKFPPKKRLLPPSKTQFAWAAEQRAEAKTYFHTRLVQWDTLGPTRAKIEAAAEAAALAALAANADGIQVEVSNAPPPEVTRSTMLTPTPTRRQVRPPSHLVFRTKIVTRTPKPK
jgi:hypothetical protein